MDLAFEDFQMRMAGMMIVLELLCESNLDSCFLSVGNAVGLFQDNKMPFCRIGTGIDLFKAVNRFI